MIRSSVLLIALLATPLATQAQQPREKRVHNWEAYGSSHISPPCIFARYQDTITIGVRRQLSSMVTIEFSATEVQRHIPLDPVRQTDHSARIGITITLPCK